MKLFKIDIFTKNGNIYFRTEEKNFKSTAQCLDYYSKKYPDCKFEIKSYEI